MDLVADSETDLFAPIPHGQGRTILREALLVADHNADHLVGWTLRPGGEGRHEPGMARCGAHASGDRFER